MINHGHTIKFALYIITLRSYSFSLYLKIILWAINRSINTINKKYFFCEFRGWMRTFIIYSFIYFHSYYCCYYYEIIREYCAYVHTPVSLERIFKTVFVCAQIRFITFNELYERCHWLFTFYLPILSLQ